MSLTVQFSGFESRHISQTDSDRIDEIDLAFRTPHQACFREDYKLLSEADRTARVHIGVEEIQVVKSSETGITTHKRLRGHAAACFVSDDFLNHAFERRGGEDWTFLSSFPKNPILTEGEVCEGQRSSSGLNLWIIALAWDLNMSAGDPAFELRTRLRRRLENELEGWRINGIYIEVFGPFVDALKQYGLIELSLRSNDEDIVLMGMDRRLARKHAPERPVRDLLIKRSRQLNLTSLQQHIMLLMCAGMSKGKICHHVWANRYPEGEMTKQDVKNAQSDLSSQLKDIARKVDKRFPGRLKSAEDATHLDESELVEFFLLQHRMHELRPVKRRKHNKS